MEKAAVENVEKAETLSGYTLPGRRFFAPGNPGRPRGTPDKRTIGGRKAAQALATEAWQLVHDLLTSVDVEPRVRLDAAKVVLEYAHGKPRHSIAIEDLRSEAERWAVRLGTVSADEILATCAEMAAEDTN